MKGKDKEGYMDGDIWQGVVDVDVVDGAHEGEDEHKAGVEEVEVEVAGGNFDGRCVDGVRVRGWRG